MPQLSRRALIATAAAVCSIGRGFPTSSSIFAGGLGNTDLLFDLCLDLKCPHALGMACLEALPAAETSLDGLASLIIQEAASHARDLTSSILLRRSIRGQIQHDFRTGAMTNVDGWVLSVTETRVYALSSLLARETTPFHEKVSVIG